MKIYLWDKEKTPLFDESIEDQAVPSIQPYIVEGAKSCVIVCAGGAYRKKSDYEAFDVCEWLNSIGVSAFNLDYRVAPYKYPAPQFDAKRAIRYARSLASKYGYDEDKIGILGFSAGGHLAGSAGVLKDDLGYEAQDDIDKLSARPDFLVLCYPVISFTKYAEPVSREMLMGEVGYAAAAELSLENRVDSDTPPTFIWTTSKDICVPCENSFMFAAMCQKYHVPMELHCFGDGGHGLGLAAYDYRQSNEVVAQWTKLCENWMISRGLI